MTKNIIDLKQCRYSITFTKSWGTGKTKSLEAGAAGCRQMKFCCCSCYVHHQWGQQRLGTRDAAVGWTLMPLFQAFTDNKANQCSSESYRTGDTVELVVRLMGKSQFLGTASVFHHWSGAFSSPWCYRRDQMHCGTVMCPVTFARRMTARGRSLTPCSHIRFRFYQ